jgi:protein-S-isoprenylcysteine O-methyltransferase Ste14
VTRGAHSVGSVRHRFATPSADRGHEAHQASPYGVSYPTVGGVERRQAGVSSRTLSPRARRIIQILANLVGAAGAAYFAYITLSAYLHTHRPIGLLFFVQQLVVVVAYLVRRPARVVTLRSADWLLAFGGTFSPVLLRPDGAHHAWGLTTGLVLQFVGVAICLWSLMTLGRSFGFAAADRGLVSRGPYALVRHPVYASYLLLQAGYLLQSISLRNVAVILLATACNVGRVLAEERVLAANPAYNGYQRRVRWRMLPGIW